MVKCGVMLEAVRTSETSVNFNVTTRHYILEDSKLYTRHRENLKSHICMLIVFWFLNMSKLGFSLLKNGGVPRQSVFLRFR
jgi:hypothetical protein